jgi:hypothetical protein
VPRTSSRPRGALISRLNRFEDAVQEAVDESEEAAAPLEIVDLRESAEDAPVIKLVHSIIAQATERGASDIHFEPQMDESGRSGGEQRGERRRLARAGGTGKAASPARPISSSQTSR